MLYAQQFDRNLLDNICELATQIRQIAKSKAGMDFLRQQLFHKTAMLYFAQPSTRTFFRFTPLARFRHENSRSARYLNFKRIKGETREDSVRTFSSFSDVVIMRHFEKGL